MYEVNSPLRFYFLFLLFLSLNSIECCVFSHPPHHRRRIVIVSSYIQNKSNHASIKIIIPKDKGNFHTFMFESKIYSIYLSISSTLAPSYPELLLNFFFRNHLHHYQHPPLSVFTIFLNKFKLNNLEFNQSIFCMLASI